MKKSKQITAGLLVMAMAVVGILSTSEVKATETTELKVEYEALTLSSDTWNKEGSIAPTKENYVFGGWFAKESDDTYTALKATDIDSNNDGTIDYTGSAYAKWVPAYVLSVKAQIDKKTQDNSGVTGTDTAYLRVISAVDSTDYQQVGFDLYYDKEYKENEDTTITKVYESIKNDETGTEPWTPEVVFGGAADLFSVLKVSQISSENCDNILYVRPYWVTMDGTRVEGLSKYVRVMDGYDSDPLISVPVNLLEGDSVAVGALQLTYDSNLEYVSYESGMLLPDMQVDTTEVGIVKLLGSTDVGENKVLTNVEPASAIYANVWFRVKDTTAEAPNHWNFTIGNENFCKWDETMVTNVKAWDVQN